MHDDDQTHWKPLTKIPQSFHSPHVWIDLSVNASLEHATILWLDLAKSKNTIALQEQTDIKILLNTIWDNTQHVFDRIPFKPVVERAFSSDNFIVLNFLLEKNAEILCQTLRLMPNGRGIGNPLHTVFKNAVQNNHVYFVENSLPYIPQTDGRDHNFLHKQIWIAAQNAHKHPQGFDDPLLKALWNGASDTCKQLAHNLATDEYNKFPNSWGCARALQLIEEHLNTDQNTRLHMCIDSNCDKSHPQRKM